MVVENEIVSQGFNWFAFVCGVIVFLMAFLLIKKRGKYINITEKVIAFFVVPILFGTAIYFLVNYMQ